MVAEAWMPEIAAILRHGSGDDVRPRRSSGNARAWLPGQLASRNGPGGHALAALEPFAGGGVVLAELARAAAPDHAPAHLLSRLLPCSAAATALSYCLRAPDRRAAGLVP